MNGSDRYPLDFQALSKGDFLSIDKLQSVLGVADMNSAAWAFAVLNLRDEIERKALLVSKIENGGIRILTDQEADEYTWASVEKRTRGLQRDVCRRSLIERDQMSEPQRRIAEARDHIATMVAVASMKELRKGFKEIRSVKEPEKIE